MSKDTTKKQTAAKTPEPMDAGAREQAVGTPATNHRRACYAAKTLVAEVLDLFPETAYEYSHYNGRNTALAVTFDLTSVAAPEDDTLAALLELTNTDVRVWHVTVEDGQVLVMFRGSAVLQDDRSPFGLADALDVLEGQEHSA